MKFTYKSTIAQGLAKLQRLKQLPEQGEQWAVKSAHQFASTMIDNLETQGRSRKPLLSGITRQVYSIDGEPDGSGIRNHIEVTRIVTGKRRVMWVAGISQGRPTLIARVQENGATIPLTPKMRGWFAVRGVHFKSSTTALRIPGRRFISRAWETTRKQSLRDLKALLKAAIR